MNELVSQLPPSKSCSIFNSRTTLHAHPFTNSNPGLPKDIAEGRRKKEEGRRKKEEGGRRKEEGGREIP
ncbi:MAG: hypothetical protein QQW96_07865 [Tychonema bourrellyi B0820]|nr:hypothetical protein [Tychonema bourrellyi B0820]